SAWPAHLDRRFWRLAVCRLDRRGTWLGIAHRADLVWRRCSGCCRVRRDRVVRRQRANARSTAVWQAHIPGRQSGGLRQRHRAIWGRVLAPALSSGAARSYGARNRADLTAARRRAWRRYAARGPDLRPHRAAAAANCGLWIAVVEYLAIVAASGRHANQLDSRAVGAARPGWRADSPDDLRHRALGGATAPAAARIVACQQHPSGRSGD